MQYSCGCINEVDKNSGVLHCVKKCAFHLDYSRTHPQGQSLQYFKDMDNVSKEGVPQNKRLIDELVLIDQMPWGGSLLELGCGLGSYIPFFLLRGYDYEAVEQSHFAVEWVRNTFDVTVHETCFEAFVPAFTYRVIFAAHFFEHMYDAPTGMKQAFDLLYTGGTIYIIVPDDADPTNPDHYWFFTPDTLKALLEKIGFVDVKIVVKQVVEREKFIYCVATKPA